MANPLVEKLQHRDSLSAEEQAALETLSLDTWTFRVGETMVRQDEAQERSTLLLEGFAARIRSTRSGKRQIVAVPMTGDAAEFDPVSPSLRREPR